MVKGTFLKLGAMLFIFMCSQAVFGLLNPGASEVSLESSTDASPAMAIISTLVYGMMFLALLPSLRAIPEMLLNAKFLLILPLFAVLSIAWSQDPAVTLRRSVVLLTVSCIAACMGYLFSLEQLGRLVTATVLVICIMSILLAIAPPHHGMDGGHLGAWKGVFTQKNVLGTFMLLGVSAAFHSRFEVYKWVRPLTIALGVILLFLSRSSTAILTLVAAFALVPLWKLIRLPLKQGVSIAIPLLTALALVGTLVYNLSDQIFGLFGKDSNLTGRAPLWALIIHSISLRPLIGYGYNAFWLGLQGESLNISVAAGWIVPHAHNGFLDILLGVGAVGLALFLLSLFRFVILVLRRLKREGTANDQLWPASFLVVLVILNLTESLLMSANSIFWLLYVAIYANLERNEQLATQQERSVILVPVAQTA